ncbi:uncharacterized protein LOC126317493 [Schistocerca gregaria]|uniref:uncharacterized protein LOC126317493 n=1 Tax=Schistocerca gregaria TaxID=7010 RepID=UPI00211EE99F|nr:uncharacterized protein LOC126317493 [Schistocerca gregaria]
MIGSGQNGVEGVLGCMKDDNVVYALVRKVHRIDQSEVVKLCYIFWIGENIDRMLRARLGTHKGFINSFLSPYHVDLSVSRREELSDSVLEDLIASVSGNKSHVLSGDRSVQGGAQPVQESVQSAQGSVRSASREVGENARSRANRETVQLQFVDKNAVMDAISSVRCDTNDTNWVLVSYEGSRRSRTLRLVGFGSGGFGEFKEKLRDDAVGYGLLRLNEVIDESVTVKFVFVNWIGEEVDRMQRAYLSTHKGFVTELFSPFHVDHECTNKSEITEEILTGKIKKAAGTANYILS